MVGPFIVERYNAVQTMRYETERSRDALQREAASLDSQLHIANARLTETHAELRALLSKLQLQQGRTHELEQLLEGVRAREFSNSFALPSPGGSPGGSQVQSIQVCTLPCVCA